MLKKWHKAMLIAFLVVATVYFLINASLTAYFLTKPHNRVGGNLLRLISGLLFSAIVPLVASLFALRQKRGLIICFGTLALIYFTFFFTVPGAVYWDIIRHFLNILPSGYTFDISGWDVPYYAAIAIAMPLLYFFSFFVLYLAIFKLKNQRKRPVNPV